MHGHSRIGAPVLSKKICMVGSFSVGKTSLVARFVESVFSDKYLTSVGVKVDKKVVTCAGQEVKLMLWDLAGKDDFQELPSSHLKGMAGYLLVVDTTRRATLQMALQLRARIESEFGPIPYRLLLNKIDLVDDWDLQEEPIDAAWLRTSCKTGEGVEEAFLGLAQAML